MAENWKEEITLAPDSDPSKGSCRLPEFLRGPLPAEDFYAAYWKQLVDTPGPEAISALISEVMARYPGLSSRIFFARSTPAVLPEEGRTRVIPVDYNPWHDIYRNRIPCFEALNRLFPDALITQEQFEDQIIAAITNAPPEKGILRGRPPLGESSPDRTGEGFESRPVVVISALDEAERRASIPRAKL